MQIVNFYIQKEKRDFYMKIVHIEDYFKPTMGYQINILPAYQVEQGHEVIIVTGNMDLPDNEYQTNKENKFINQDKKYEERTGVRIIRVDVVKNISNRAIFNNKIFKIVNDLAPDIVYVHGNDTL